MTFRYHLYAEKGVKRTAVPKGHPLAAAVLPVKMKIEEESRGTVRSAAKKFGISKSTVHKDLSERLPAFNRGLYLQVKQVLEENKAQRHIRGGLATRRKYKGE